MKSLVYSIILLSSIILSTVLAATYTDKRLEDFGRTVSELREDSEKAYLDAIRIEEKYEKIKLSLTLFMNENDVREIEMHISDIKSAAKANDLTGIVSAKSHLMLHTEQLRRLSVFSIEAIF